MKRGTTSKNAKLSSFSLSRPWNKFPLKSFLASNFVCGLLDLAVVLTAQSTLVLISNKSCTQSLNPGVIIATSHYLAAILAEAFKTSPRKITKWEGDLS